jgi:hypothetical protein
MTSRALVLWALASGVAGCWRSGGSDAADADAGSPVDSEDGTGAVGTDDSDTGTEPPADTDLDSDSDGDADTETGSETDSCGKGMFDGFPMIIDQVDVEALEGYTEVSGDVLVMAGDVESLEGLGCLEHIGGNLSIGFYPLDGIVVGTHLTNLDGLERLAAIDGDLLLAYNYQLADLDGLCSLTTVGGEMRVEEHEELSNLDGLASLTSIGGDLRFWFNYVLEDMTGLCGLESLGEFLMIVANYDLPACQVDSFLQHLEEEGWAGETDILSNDGEGGCDAGCVS